MLSEAQGCAVLRRVFERRGYTIEENVSFSEENVVFNADGWDAVRRVGYEFLTDEAEDHLDLPPQRLAQLEAWTAQGHLHFFLVDEKQVESEDDLAWAAQRFLDEVEKRRGAP